MTAGEATAIATVIGSVLTLLGVTGIDSSVVNGIGTGLIAFFTLCTAIHAWWAQRKVVGAARAAGAIK